MFSGLENPTHLLLVFLVVLLLFGAKRLPELGRSLGSGIRGFKEALTGQEALISPDEAASEGDR
jgi:sec-independent protein translocase protein TatA